ncbi:MAG: 16S rRNA (guanine(527)-N(7))-methyltransferase RsmG [Bacteroidota bacterium]
MEIPDWSRFFPELTETQKNQLDSLPLLVREWNQHINLISRKDEDSLAVHHVLHSLALAKVISFEPGSRILDVGTGGGFPALPLAILFPDVEWVAVDSIGKKIKVVQDLAERLGLHNLQAKHQRAEEVQGPFDFVVSRAVARMQSLVQWTRSALSRSPRHTCPNGWLVLKGGDPQEGLKDELEEVGLPYALYPVSTYFEEPYFDQKFVVYMSPQPFQSLA